MSVAELKTATKRYGNVQALRGIDLAIEPGQLLALLGPNGAGKTTAVKLLLGLASPTSGTATVFGRDPRDRSARVRTGAMLQVARVPESLRVREHIALFSSYYPAPRPMKEVVEAAGLAGIENRLFGELSGGQRQRVLFALAICGNPDLLFLDEPTAGLDVEARRSLWTNIREFVKRGGAVLLTTHYLEEADALADRIVVINGGTIAASGTPSEIKARTAGKRILCRTELETATVREMAGVRAVSASAQRIEIQTAYPERVLRELLQRDPTLSDIEVTANGLEDAFLAITNTEQKSFKEAVA